MTISIGEMAFTLGKAQRSGSGWFALCPAHDDRKTPNLSLKEDNGKILDMPVPGQGREFLGCP